MILILLAIVVVAVVDITAGGMMHDAVKVVLVIVTLGIGIVRTLGKHQLH